MDLHVLLSFQTTTTISIRFDLLMSRGGVDIFALVINYLDKSWIPQHVIIGSFEVQKTNSNAMAL
jgi:hypothetical protein